MGRRESRLGQHAPAELERGGLLAVRRSGNANLYRLRRPALVHQLLDADGLRWARWQRLFGALLAALAAERATESPAALRRVTLNNALQDAAHAATLLGWEAPPTVADALSHEPSLVTAWIESRLAAEVGLPAAS
ncbi:MAG: hypothetical protein ACI9K2_006081 [Myxococcota bacterium]